MICHKIGRPPISTIGFGFTSVSSERRVPSPPARITTFRFSMSFVVSQRMFLTVYDFSRATFPPHNTQFIKLKVGLLGDRANLLICSVICVFLNHYFFVILQHSGGYEERVHLRKGEEDYLLFLRVD